MGSNRLTAPAAMAVAAALAFVVSPAPASAATCTPGGSDFDGDGCADLVVADPYATVAGKTQAGRVNVLYGSGASAVLAQGQTGVSGVAESYDRFGTTVQTGEFNSDSYADLVVATPAEAVGSADDAGIIQVIFGSSDGLGGGRPSVTIRQGRNGVPGTPEAGDRFGAALAVNTTEYYEGSTVAALAFGAPGEDVGSVSDAGTAGVVVFDRTGEVSASSAITQNSPGIAGSVESGDQFGSAVGLVQAPSDIDCVVTGFKGFTLVVGAPGEDSGSVRDVGMVHVVRSLTSDAPLTQNTDGVSGSAEAGDRFGASLAVKSTCAPDDPTRVTVAVGVPNEDIGSVSDAGAVHLFRAVEMEPMDEVWNISQNTADVANLAESGDRFGSTLALGGTWRSGMGKMVVVGVPGEDTGSLADAGVVQVFGDETGTPGATDVQISQQTVGAVPEAGDRFGASLTATYRHLYVGAPDDVTYPTGVVHGLTWQAVFGEPEPSLLFAPGKDGVPTGASRFGAELA